MHSESYTQPHMEVKSCNLLGLILDHHDHDNDIQF